MTGAVSGHDRDEMLDVVRAQGLLSAARPVVVLLSGGRDSTCLLDLAVRVAGARSVTALHVNYGLREAADADQRHCVKLCEQLGVPLEVRRPQRGERGNLQAWARDQRYHAGARVALARGADVAAGHTATDQVETILYRLASSPSRRALLGMRARTGLLVRPLLAFTREQTARYCAERGLAWREDESNESGAYARNRIRGGLLPALLQAHPQALENVLALADVLRDEAAVLDGFVDEVLRGRSEIELCRLRALTPALARLVVQRLADEAAGAIAPGVARRLGDVVALSDRGTVELDVGAGVRAVAEYGVVHFERLGAGGEVAPDAVTLRIPGAVMFGASEVSCKLGPPAREPGVLDRAALGDELLVRGWRAGDRMSPLGLGASKSLQDLFTARRVPRRQRCAVAVVECRGEIVWVAGVATSERFKVTESTRQAVRLSVRRREPPRV
jgi:tRNA(Ile)-lysidine synthase